MVLMLPASVRTLRRRLCRGAPPCAADALAIRYAERLRDRAAWLQCAQSLQVDGFGYLALHMGNMANTFQLNAAANFLALGFIDDNGQTVTKFRFWVTSVTGSLGANDIRVDLFSDTGGKPNATLGNVTGTVSAGWNEFTITGVALTAGTKYHFVVRNLNGTPASNFATLGWQFSNSVGQNAVNATAGAIATGACWTKWSSTNSGTTWLNGQANACGYRIGYNDSTYVGAPISASAGTGTAKIFGTNQAGLKFTTPANVTINLRGVTIAMSLSGAPAGNVVANVWSGSGGTRTLQAISYTILNADAISTSIIPFYFGSDFTLNGNTSYTVTVQDLSADSSAAYFALQEDTWDSDANSLTLTPFGGTLQKTTCSNGPNGAGTVGTTTATFTDTNTILTPMILWPDSGGEFAAGSSSSPNAGIRSGGRM